MLLRGKLPLHLVRKLPNRLKHPLEAQLPLGRQLLVIPPRPVRLGPISAPRNPHAPQPDLLSRHMVDRQAPRHVQQLPPVHVHTKLPPHPLKQVPEIPQARLVAPDRLGRVHGVEAGAAQRAGRGARDVGLVDVAQDDKLVVLAERLQAPDRVGERGPPAGAVAYLGEGCFVELDALFLC